MNSAPAPDKAAANVCPQCGARFRCGMAGGDKDCWCASLPALLPLPAKSGPESPGAGCLCPDCLKARLAAASGPPGSAASRDADVS